MQCASDASRAGVRASIVASTMLFLAALPVAAAGPGSLTPDDVAVTGGHGNSVDIVGVAVGWNLPREGRVADQGGFDARLVAQVSYWRGTQSPTSNRSLWDFGLTPMLRWTAPGAGPPRFFAEAGVGVNLLTATRINNDRIFSTAFQFGEQGGAGIAFGPEHRYELGVYVQHVSNGAIKEPNDGLTYVGVVFRVATR